MYVDVVYLTRVESKARSLLYSLSCIPYTQVVRYLAQEVGRYSHTRTQQQKTNKHDIHPDQMFPFYTYRYIPLSCLPASLHRPTLPSINAARITNSCFVHFIKYISSTSLTHSLTHTLSLSFFGKAVVLVVLVVLSHPHGGPLNACFLLLFPSLPFSSLLISLPLSLKHTLSDTHPPQQTAVQQIHPNSPPHRDPTRPSHAHVQCKPEKHLFFFFFFLSTTIIRCTQNQSSAKRCSPQKNIYKYFLG